MLSLKEVRASSILSLSLESLVCKVLPTFEVIENDEEIVVFHVYISFPSISVTTIVRLNVKFVDDAWSVAESIGSRYSKVLIIISKKKQINKSLQRLHKNNLPRYPDSNHPCFLLL